MDPGTQATGAGMSVARTNDLVLTVNELVTNSVRHAGGQGVLRVWQQPDGLVCEVADRGRIDEPLAGRERPPTDGEGGLIVDAAGNLFGTTDWVTGRGDFFP